MRSGFGWQLYCAATRVEQELSNESAYQTPDQTYGPRLPPLSAPNQNCGDRYRQVDHQAAPNDNEGMIGAII